METSRKKVVDLNIEDVLPNRFQPRIKFNESAIEELSKSIKEHGVIQPIVVRPIGDKFEIIAGERRYKASLLAGKTTIPAIITDLNDKDSAEVALIENVQRENLTPIEEAISYKKILDMGYITQDALASKLGKTQSTVANKLRLLNLDDEVQEALLNERISERHARSLLKIQDKQKQREMLNKIIAERLTVRRADEEIEKLLNGEKMNEIKTEIQEEKADEPTTQNETNRMKFINVPLMEEENKEMENVSDDEPTFEDDNEIEEQDNLKPGKFFNILNEEKEESKPEEQIFDFNKMFMNPVEEQTPINSNNALLEELNEIENSINNSKNITPIEQKPQEPEEDLEFIEEDDFEEESEENEPPKFINIQENEQKENIEEKIETEQKNEQVQEEKIVVPQPKINNFKDVLQLIRDCSEKIEDAGFVIDTEEYDLEGMYQVVFKINK